MRPISLAVDVTNYVMLEIGRPIHGYDADKLQGPIRVRRAADGERLTTLDGTERTLSTEDLVVTDDSGIIGLGGVMGGETTEMSATTTNILVEAAHWDATSMFRTGKRHKITSEAGKRNERGVDPVITAGRGRPRGRAADDVRRRHGRPGRHRRRHAAGAAGDHHRLRPARPGHRHARSTRPPRSPTSRPSAARSAKADTDAHRDPAAVAARPHRPVRPGRGGRPDRRLRPGAVGAAPRGRRPRAHPRAAAAPPGRPHPGRCRLRRGDQLPVRRRRRVRRARPAGRRRRCAAPSGWPTRSRSEEPSYTTTLLPGLLKAAARNLGRGASGVALFETGTVAFPVRPRPGADLRRRLAPERRRARQAARGDPRAAAAPRLVLAGERERAGWWGAGREAGWSDAIGAGPPPRRRARRRRRGHRRGPDARGTRAAAPRSWSAASSSGTPASCTRRSARRSACRPRSAAVEIDLDFLMRHARDVTPGPGVLDVPGRQGGRRAGRRRRRDRRRRRGRAARGCRRAAGVDPALRRLHRRPGRRRARKSLAFALRFRAPDRTLTEEETAAARDAAVALAAERTGAVQR